LDSQGVCQLKQEVIIENCQTVTDGVCVLCNSGFFLDQNNTCMELPANCVQVDQIGQCTECGQGFVLIEGSNCVE
jgi:hypothetical protein